MSKQADPLALLADANQSYNWADFSTAALCYKRAIEPAKDEPTESFAAPAFIAECNAGLAGAYNALRKPRESLACAEEALAFFDRFGALYGASLRPRVVALLGKGVSLANLGRPKEGLKTLQGAKDLLASLEKNQLTEVYLSNCEEAINAIQGMEGSESTTRKWWEFWK